MEALPKSAVDATDGAGGETGSVPTSVKTEPKRIMTEAQVATQFKPGNPGGPGRPKVRPMREAFRKHIQDNPEDLAKIAERLVMQAKNGDAESIKILRDTMEGRPTQAVELTGGEDEETGETKAIPVILIPAAENKL